MIKNDIYKLSVTDKKKFDRAMKDYQELLNEIKPFIKKPKRKEYSTRGEWKIFSY